MKVNLKVSKLELLEWYPNNDIMLSSGQMSCYKNNDWLNFYQEIKDGSLSGYAKEKAMLDTWFEVIDEPNYDEWIGKWCVFSDKIIDKNSLEITLSKLIKVGIEKNYPFRTSCDIDYRYCMLLSDFQKMIKEQE